MSYMSEWLVYLILRYNIPVGRGRGHWVMGGRENRNAHEAVPPLSVAARKENKRGTNFQGCFLQHRNMLGSRL